MTWPFLPSALEGCRCYLRRSPTTVGGGLVIAFGGSPDLVSSLALTRNNRAHLVIVSRIRKSTKSPHTVLALAVPFNTVTPNDHTLCRGPSITKNPVISPHPYTAAAQSNHAHKRNPAAITQSSPTHRAYCFWSMSEYQKSSAGIEGEAVPTRVVPWGLRE